MNGQRNIRLSFHIWLGSCIFLFVVVLIIFVAAATKLSLNDSARLPRGVKQVIVEIANYPARTIAALEQVWSQIRNVPYPLLIERKIAEKKNWVRKFPNEEDPGYLLFSGVDADYRQAIVSLIRIADGKVMARWIPDWEDIFSRTTDKELAKRPSKVNAGLIHPLLLDDGSIIANNRNALMRFGACQSKPTWVLDLVTHHSIEMSRDGTVWTLGTANDGFPENPWLTEHLRDDALVHVTIDGQVLKRLSFSKILRENGLESLLLGHAGNVFNEDPIHLNEISVATIDSKFWLKDDLLISSRHLSTVFLYRPSTGRIGWFKQGPWMNQHAARFVDGHRISVFDNNVVGGAPRHQPFIVPNSINRIFVYNFDTQVAEQPYRALLEQARPVTVTQGRAEVLPDGGVFVEETSSGRHMRFSKDSLMWSRINDFDSDYVGTLFWSRYLSSLEAAKALENIAKSGACRSSGLN